MKRLLTIIILLTTSDFLYPQKITAIFNENVFTLQTARQYLSDEAYKSLIASVKSGKKIDRSMMDWGVTIPQRYIESFL